MMSSQHNENNPLLSIPDLPVGIVIFGSDTRIRYANHEAEGMMGMSMDDMIGMILPDLNVSLFHEDDSPMASEECPVYMVRMTSKPVRDVCIGIRHALEQGITWITVNAIPEFAYGRLERIVITAMDITARKISENKLRESEIHFRAVAEAALRESEDRFSWVLHNSPACQVITTYPEGRILDVNDAYCKLMGYKRDELINRTTHELNLRLNEVDRQSVFKEFSESERINRTETTFRNRDGEKRTVIASEEIFELKGVPCVISTALDITDRIQTEQAHKTNMDRLSLALEAAQAGTWEWDLRRNVYFWSDELWKIFGLDKDSCKPCYESWLKTIHIDDRDRVETAIRHAVQKAESLNVEWRVYDAAGIERWLLSRGQPVVSADGRVIRYNGIVLNITDRKRAEEENKTLQEQLFLSQKMESVGRLAGGVAHDFNNMLSVIIGNTELVLDSVSPDDTIYEDLMDIISAARRSADLTRQLLAFARKQTVAPKIMDLNDTVEGTLKMLRRLIGEDIDLVWLPGKNVGSIEIDPTQIDQLLANLCVNARDAISDVGRITIETDMAVIDEEYCLLHPGFTPGDFTVLSISDNGCGMSRETVEKIYDPFFTTKGTGKGTGLGLATVYGIVKQNNGCINVFSEPGVGTTFRIYMNRYDGSFGEMAGKHLEKIPDGNGETILVVEDETAILKMTERILINKDYNVLISKTPTEAVSMARQYRGDIDLLITDVVMPGMNGRELSDILKTLCPGIKCLFMSGYTANVIAHRGVIYKNVHFLQKPFKIRDLIMKVRAILDEG